MDRNLALQWFFDSVMYLLCFVDNVNLLVLLGNLYATDKKIVTCVQEHVACMGEVRNVYRSVVKIRMKGCGD
jgi:hypothetical protein